MAIDLKTTKMLWGRAAALCAICRIQLNTDSTETDDGALIGEMCHIVAEKSDGPRGDPSFSSEMINRYGNLILLCPNHHTEIDKNLSGYPVEKLHKTKQLHEEWVRRSLPTYDALKQRDDEVYADYIAEWADRSELDRWADWSSFFLGGGQPMLSTKLDEKLYDLRGWLLTRVWPNRYPALESAFENFRHVLQDFQETFRQHAELPYPAADALHTQKFYRIDDWNPERYHRLVRQYNDHVDLAQDLMLELTRAANLVCDRVRASIYHGFRLKEGRLAVMSGPHEDLRFHTFVPQYTKEQAELGIPYPGLEEFRKILATRDRHFGNSTVSTIMPDK